MRINSRVFLISGLLFIAGLFYVPLFSCFPDVDTKHSHCDLYGVCKVDYFYSLFSVIAEGCPNNEQHPIQLALYTAIIALVSFLVSQAIEYYYVRFRDI